MAVTSPGLCGCGCGGETQIAKVHGAARKGEPMPYLPSHSPRRFSQQYDHVKAKVTAERRARYATWRAANPPRPRPTPKHAEPRIPVDRVEHAYTLTSWQNMRKRCNTPASSSYAYYGGRGITVCERWDSLPNGFARFLADMGPRPQGHTIDRIDPDGNYELSNCRWATAKQQRANQRAAS